MGTQTLRPNATYADHPSWDVSGTGTKHGVLADNVDANHLAAQPPPQFQTWVSTTIKFALTTYALAAGERVKQVRHRLRARGNGSAKVRLTSSAEASGGATHSPELVATPASGAWSTHTGPWVVPGYLSDAQQAVVDALNVHLWRDSGGTGDVTEVYLDLDVWQRTDAPSVSAPSGTIADTDVPDVTWTVATLGDGSPSTWSRQVRVFRDEVYLAGGFDPATEADVEWEALQTSQGSTGGTVQVGEPLANGDTYRAYVRVGKENVAGQTLWSTWGNSQFALDLTEPTPPTLSVTVEQAQGRQRIEVTPAALTHDTLDSVRIERSEDGGATWATIRGGLVVEPIAPSTTTTVYDHDAPRATELDYRARVTEGISGGGTVSSDWTVDGPHAHPDDGDWWVFDVPEFTRVVSHVHVSVDPEYEVAADVGVFRPPGRREAVVVSGTVHGFDGAWTIRASGVADAAALDAIATWGASVLVKSPFGWQRYVRFVERALVESGTPDKPRHVWTLGFVEVDDGIGDDG